MKQFKKHVARAAFIIMVANSCQTVQAIDWSYWSGYASDTVRKLVQYAPSKERIVEQLKQPRTWGAVLKFALQSVPSKERIIEQLEQSRTWGVLTLCALTGMYIIKQMRSSELRESARELLNKDYSLEHNGYTIKFGTNLFLLEKNKWSIHFDNPNVDQLDVHSYINQLDEVIAKYESQDMFQRFSLRFGCADKALLEQLKKRKVMMETFKAQTSPQEDFEEED